MNNRKKIIQKNLNYKLKKLATDVNYRIACLLRARLRTAIKNNHKTGSAIKDLGCSIEEFKIHIENKFYVNRETNQNMTWENYGFYGWHIDHIVPLSYFDLTDRKQFLKACHYTNLQPLWAKDNLKKGNRITTRPSR